MKIVKIVFAMSLIALSAQTFAGLYIGGRRTVVPMTGPVQVVPANSYTYDAKSGYYWDGSRYIFWDGYQWRPAVRRLESRPNWRTESISTTPQPVHVVQPAVIVDEPLVDVQLGPLEVAI